ncbi:MAG: hypothetical protein V4732_03605 [Pseudomonadota bacterium]
MAKLSQILSPEYQHAPLVVYSLDGVELLISLPQHQSTTDSVLAPSDIDIFNQSVYQGGPPPNERYILLIKNAWSYRFENSSIDAGTLFLTVAIVHSLDEREKNYNFLDGESCAEWIIDRMVKSYSPLDAESIEELKLNDLPFSETHLWIYPKKASDLEKIMKNGMHWYRGKTGHPSMGEPQPFFRIPINSRFALEMNIHFGGFNPEYFEFPETIETTKEFLLQEFLEHVRITYPPEILAQVTNTNTL